MNDYLLFFSRLLVFPNPFHTDFWILSGFTLLLAFWGIITFRTGPVEKTVEIRAKTNILLWTLVFTLISFTYARSMAIFHPALAMPAMAMVITGTLTHLKKTRFAEMILLVYFFAVLLNNLFIHNFLSLILMKHAMLRNHYSRTLIEAGCDEAGRGCLAGPVFAAAVILPRDFRNSILTDSKQLTEKQRDSLRLVIETQAIAWAVASVDAEIIDEINILNASILAMHRAVGQLAQLPQLLIIDGNRFKPYPGIPHHCIVKGDEKFLSIAAASVLAKTYRDEFMRRIHEEYPVYNWINNKGYPSKQHRGIIATHGITPWHRKSFRMNG